MELLLLMTGSTAVVLVVAWLLRRHRSDVGVLDDEEYEGPPPIHGQAGPH